MNLLVVFDRRSYVNQPLLTFAAIENNYSQKNDSRMLILSRS